jgi:uncharacterized protein (UPF0305 family)
VRRRVTDLVLETVVALIAPYAAFVPSEALHPGVMLWLSRNRLWSRGGA